MSPPRIVMETSEFRVVETRVGAYTFEVTDGKDAMQAPRWVEFKSEAITKDPRFARLLGALAGEIVSLRTHDRSSLL